MRTIFVLGLLGCKTTDDTDTDGSDTAVESDTDTDADTDSDTDTDTDSDSDTDADTDLPVCEQPIQCQAGQGRTQFEVVPQGGDIEMFHGPQGGWHVDTAVQVDSTTQVVRILPQVTVVSTNQLLAGGGGLADSYNQALVLTGDCSGDAWALMAIFDEQPTTLPDVCALEGEELRIDIEVSDLDGNTAFCTTTGVATLHPSDVEPCSSL